MSLQPPKIDTRTYQDIVNQTEELAKKFTDWRPRPDGKPDAGMAMIRIFGRMAALVSDRLNQVPDKNFLAFLDLIGTQLLPPQPAKVPLTFSLAQGSPVDALVPAHTQVAAPPAEGQEEVVFETDRELVVTTAQLQAVFVREPEKDKYSDRTLQATGKKDAAFEAFAGEQPIEHCLYLACDELFTLPGNKTVTLKFDFTDKATDLAKLPINWWYWDGSWRSLPPFLDQKAGNSEVTINNLPVPTPLTINGIEAGWLRASLEQSFLDEEAKEGTTQLKVKDVRGFIAVNNTIRIATGSNNQEDSKITKIDEKKLTIEPALKYSHPKESNVCLSKLPTINRITVSAEIQKNDLTPDFCFFNTVPLDLSKDFYLFGEQPRFNDTLYIASQEAFAKPGVVVKINLQLTDGIPIKTNGGVEVAWETWDGHKWKLLKTEVTPSSAGNFTKTGEVILTLPSEIAQGTVNGETSYWIRARIVKGDYGKPASSRQRQYDNGNPMFDNNGHPIYEFIPASFQPPSVKSLSLNYSYKTSSALSACRAYNNFHYVDLLNTTLREEAKFGEKIIKLASVSGFAKGDHLWIGRREEREIEAVDLKQRTVTVEPALANAHVAEILVEFFTILQEEAKSGETILKLSSVKQFAVGDRLRIVTTNTDNTQEYEIEGVNLDSHSVMLKPALTQTYPKNTKVLQSFQPFKATTDRERTLYLGFDKPFANRPTTLFTQVEPSQPKEVASQQQTIDTKPVQLVWEYASPSGWSSLGVKDETSAFAERGLIQFIGPTDFIKTSEFDQELYWLRVRWQEGQFRVPPRLRRLLTNTMWATQATTLKEEILGSSDGNPKQIFDTVQKPVLKGEQLEVQEAKIPSPEEHEVIRSLEGDDAVNIVRDETGQIEAVWVRWHNVRDFYGSGPHDRHYVLDRLTGEVQFGDGQYGMVPPQGRNNIRHSQYQTGGGTQGNLAANTVVQLKTTVPYVEKVTNLEAAGGGAEQESLEQVKQRGPKFLRHRGRAVTWQDFEDIAYEASPDVARAKAIAPSFNPLDRNLWIKDPKAPNLDQHKRPDEAGQIRMLIVPRSQARQPVPSLALIDRVTAYVQERCDPSVNLQVTGPEWQAVSVTAEVVPVSLERADAVRAAVVQHLENFLHPLSGGKKGQGWALGRLPQQSDLYAVIESIPGVDYVQSLKIQTDSEELSPEKLVYSGIHTVTSILPEEGA